MLHACVQRFDVMCTVRNFLGTKQDPCLNNAKTLYSGMEGVKISCWKKQGKLIDYSSPCKKDIFFRDAAAQPWVVAVALNGDSGAALSSRGGRCGPERRWRRWARRARDGLGGLFFFVFSYRLTEAVACNRLWKHLIYIGICSEVVASARLWKCYLTVSVKIIVVVTIWFMQKMKSTHCCCRAS